MVEGVGVGEGRRDLRYGSATARHGIAVEEIGDAHGAAVLPGSLCDSAGDVARHIENSVADVLVVEEAEAGAQHQLGIGRLGNAEARSEVGVHGVHQGARILAVAADGRGIGR